jgi:hypothetical protein
MQELTEEDIDKKVEELVESAMGIMQKEYQHPYVPFEAHREKAEEKIREQVAGLRKRLQRGYRLLLKESKK